MELIIIKMGNLLIIENRVIENCFYINSTLSFTDGVIVADK